MSYIGLLMATLYRLLVLCIEAQWSFVIHQPRKITVYYYLQISPLPRCAKVFVLPLTNQLNHCVTITPFHLCNLVVFNLCSQTKKNPYCTVLSGTEIQWSNAFTLSLTEVICLRICDRLSNVKNSKSYLLITVRAPNFLRL